MRKHSARPITKQPPCHLLSKQKYAYYQYVETLSQLEKLAGRKASGRLRHNGVPDMTQPPDRPVCLG
jgi:hypothetical protein